MSEPPEFPKSAEEVGSALAELLELQGKADLAGLVRNADQSISVDGSDDWGSETWYCTLHLSVPTPTFAVFEGKLDETERTLAGKLEKLIRNTGAFRLTRVTISARPSAISWRRVAPSAEDSDRIWERDCLRLFLSHVSAHKVKVSQLKTEIRGFGVSAFVAHEDIEPNTEWQREIELALDSMHGLAALLTPDFHESKWTDQEVGFAFGRGIPVIPIRLGLDPYGFTGKTQGMTGNIDKPALLAVDIARTLLREKRTKVVMREALVTALEQAPSFMTAKRIATLLESVEGCTAAQLERLAAACRDNPQVKNAWGVPEIIRKIS